MANFVIAPLGCERRTGAVVGQGRSSRPRPPNVCWPPDSCRKCCTAVFFCPVPGADIQQGL